MGKIELISRRGLLTGTAALLGAATLEVVAQGTASPSSASWVSTSDREVDFIRAADSRFANLVGELYPGLLNDPEFESIMPLSALIVHKRGRPIKACSLDWAVTTPSGTYQGVIFFYLPPGMRRLQKKGATLSSAQRPLIRRGQCALVMPYGCWSPSYYKGHSQPDWTSLRQKNPTGAFLESQVASAAGGPYIGIDGLIFADNKIAGNDAHNLSRRIRAVRNAQHDESLAIFKLISAGATDTAINARLLAAATLPRLPIDGPPRWYAQARKHHAQLLLKLAARLDRRRFIKVLRWHKTMRKTVIRKLAA
jgi:hypothetical protein